jgi:antitoxin component of RelBE/YafQ-DinJ toxin-antitoxin module
MKNELSRITIDIPTSIHKKFKSFAASEGKSMREVVLELIKSQVVHSAKANIPSEDECPYDHTPNKRTIRAIKDAQNRKDLIQADNVKELFKKLRS